MRAIVTQPSITYYAKYMNKDTPILIDNPVEIDNPDLIKVWYEPICTASILTPAEYLKNIKTLCYDRRGMLEYEEYINDGQLVSMQYEIPLAELVIDFFDKLKSLS